MSESRVTFYGEVGPQEWSWGVRSFSRPDVVHECSINLETGECFCVCEDHFYRRRKWLPTLDNGCRHIAEVVKETIRIMNPPQKARRAA